MTFEYVIRGLTVSLLLEYQFLDSDGGRRVVLRPSDRVTSPLGAR